MRDEIARQIADEVLAVYGAAGDALPWALPLTVAQRRVLDAIGEYQERRGLSPLLTEIGETLGVSKVTICEHLKELERKGWITREPHRARAIVVLDVKKRRATDRLMQLARVYAAAK